MTDREEQTREEGTLQEVGAEACACLSWILEGMGMDAEVEFLDRDGQILLNVICGDDSNLLIGRKGQTLEALQTIVTRITARKFPRVGAGQARILVDIEGYRELLDGEHEARLFPNRDVDALARTAIAVLRDERIRHAMAAAGRSKAERYSWPGIARTLEALYFDLVDRRTTAGDARIRLAS